MSCTFNPTFEELLLDGDDCNNNGIDDVLEIVNDPSLDANGNWQIDACEDGLIGDVNCDNVLNLLDVSHFVTALIDPIAYNEGHPGCPIARADINGDVQVNGQDIQGFLRLILANQ